MSEEESIIANSLQKFRENPSCPKCGSIMVKMGEGQGGYLLILSKNPNVGYSVPALEAIWKCPKCKKKARRKWTPKLEEDEEEIV